jgi:signal transduction histidine kinase
MYRKKPMKPDQHIPISSSPVPIHLLLVEDNPGDARLVYEMLRDPLHIKLEVADCLAACMARLEQGGIDIVLLDLGLSDSQGLDTLISVAHAHPELPVVALTGLDDDALALRTVQAGGQDYLTKNTVTPEILRRTIRYAIERKRVEVALQASTDEVKTMSQQLLQAEKLATMGVLASSIAHELNNPLATVSLRVESLIAQTTGDDPRLRELEIIGQEVERMGNLVSNLLQFSRRSQPQISTVNVCDEIEKTLELVHYHLRKHNITVVREFKPEEPLIHADRQQLRQLFLNLFTNASDAMPEGGALTVRVTQCLEEKQICIEIADTGAGIPAEILPKVLEPFYTTKPEGKGTGLGLAICRRIAEGHYGTLAITSGGGPGKGTRVCITLPFSNGHNSACLKDE